MVGGGAGVVVEDRLDAVRCESCWLDCLSDGSVAEDIREVRLCRPSAPSEGMPIRDRLPTETRFLAALSPWGVEERAVERRCACNMAASKSKVTSRSWGPRRGLLPFKDSSSSQSA